MTSLQPAPLWEIDAFLDATRGRPAGVMPMEIGGISIDSRSLKPGDAFFAIRGDRFDGHDFLTGAMKAGAALAVVSEDKLVALGRLKLPLVVVSDVLEAMRRLAMAARARSKARIIAVTGSVGKTTTKEMLRTALSACGPVHASAASFNNHWGVPLTLASMPAETRYGVFEIGMNHPDEIRPLVKLVRPHVAMITAIAAAHLGAFESLEGIAAAKAEIFEGVVKGGHGLINNDDKRAKLLSRMALDAGIENLATYGSKRGSTFRIKSIEEQGDQTAMTMMIARREVSVTLNVPGRHIAQNAAGVLAAATLAGADPEVCARALSEVSAGKGRGARHQLNVKGGSALLIDESYNANPASVEAAIATLARAATGKGGRRIAVLGDMLELGKTSRKLHATLARPLARAGIDVVITVGTEMEALAEALRAMKDGKQGGVPRLAGHFADWEKALPAIRSQMRAGDAIVLKASNGLRFAALASALLEASGGDDGSGGAGD